MTGWERDTLDGAGYGDARVPPPDLSTPLPPPCLEAIAHLRRAVASGGPWPVALLQAMGLWTLAEEVWRGRLNRYLILDEAFDWLLLARRLAGEVDGLIPRGERVARLHTGRFIQEIPEEEVRGLLGDAKYTAYLNYWYGVTAESALHAVVWREVRKERASRGLSPRGRLADDVFRRIYGEPFSPLLEAFNAEHGSPGPDTSRPGDKKPFTYWLFRVRLRRCEPSRVASDTRKALEWLMQGQRGSPPAAPEGLLKWPERPFPTGNGI